MERTTRETVEEDYKYLAFDVLIDMALEGTVTLEEAIDSYKVDMGL